MGKTITSNKALVVNFSCKPNSGSEWGIGWNYLLLLSRNFQQVTLFVRDAEGQITAIIAELNKLGIKNIIIEPVNELFIYRYFSKPYVHSKLLIIYYHIWLYKVFFTLLFRFNKYKSYFLFQNTWTSDWIFSPIYLIPFKKRVIGPIGSQPDNYYSNKCGKLKSKIRFYLKSISRYNPLLMVNVLLSDGVIGITDFSLGRFPWTLSRNRHLINQNHSELKYFKDIRLDKKLIFIGKNIPFKNLDLFIKIAMNIISITHDIMVEVIGDMGEFCPLIGKHKDNERIIFLGKITLDELAGIQCTSRTILLQTAAEMGGTVGVESLSMRTPVVCTEGFGVSAFYTVNNLTSYPFTVRYINEDQYIKDASSLVIKIFENWDECSNIANQLSLKFTFENTDKQITKLITSLLDE